MYQVTIDDQYKAPFTLEGEGVSTVEKPAIIETNEAYVNMVMNIAAKSYATHYKTTTFDDGITAARLAYNATITGEPDPNLDETDQLLVDYLEGDL